MIFIPISVILSSLLTLAFKVLGRLQISAFQSIVFNYITCVVVGSLVQGRYPVKEWVSAPGWLPWGILMGTLFISLFNMIGWVTQRMGVAVASVSNKLSLVVPFLFSVWVLQEQASMLNFMGVALAIAAVVLTCWPHETDVATEKRHKHWYINLIPVILFLGSGCLDTLITYTEKRFLDGENSDSFLILAFHTAGLVGLLLLLAGIITRKIRFDPRAVIAGIGIGIPNYFSIQTLVMALDGLPGQSGLVMPLVNIGIVLFSTIVAYLVFQERLSRINWAGIALAVVAIIMMAFR